MIISYQVTYKDINTSIYSTLLWVTSLKIKLPTSYPKLPRISGKMGKMKITYLPTSSPYRCWAG